MTALKNWTMVLITFVFVVLYIGALLGWLKPFSDVTMVMRLEPVIFAILGFYFGRMPARETEKNLREEIERQINNADVARVNCEQIQQEREVLEEKLKNVQAILRFAEKASVPNLHENKFSTAKKELSSENLLHTLKTAINVLNS